MRAEYPATKGLFHSIGGISKQVVDGRQVLEARGRLVGRQRFENHLADGA